MLFSHILRTDLRLLGTKKKKNALIHFLLEGAPGMTLGGWGGGMEVSFSRHSKGDVEARVYVRQ